MKERILVEVVQMWDGIDRETSQAAVIKIVLPLFRPEHYRDLQGGDVEREVAKSAERDLQALVTRSFNSEHLRVKVIRIRSGSLHLLITLVAIGGSVYKFFKDYEAFRKGLFLFVDDVKQVGARFERHTTSAYNDAVRRSIAKRQENKQRRGISH